MQQWFGQKYDAPVYEECTQTDPPIGRDCSRCGEPIVQGDDGFTVPINSVFHRACFLRGVVGSIQHQMHLCFCYTKEANLDLNDLPVAQTVRQEAEAAVKFWENSKSFPE